MPFLVRKIEPRYLCRGHIPEGPGSRDWPVGEELQAVANGALTASLKQLSSLLVTAEDIFAVLTNELTGIVERSGKLKSRIERVEEKLSTVDPKKITVPESDICTFAQRKEHFHQKKEITTSLFTVDSRPKAVKELYDAAAAAAVRSLDSLNRDREESSMDMFLCTPVLSKKKRDQSLEIESRIPRAIEELRRWTSTEALGDVTVQPDCTSRIISETLGDDAVDHKLPSPEEQLQAVALRYPAEIVAVDVSGRNFRRMSMRRKSMQTTGGQDAHQETVKRRSRPRRPRGKRRNTIAGTDQKEIRKAIEGEIKTEDPEETHANKSTRAHRSASSDILGITKESPVEKKSHFNTLKAWGKSRLKLISPKSNQQLNSQSSSARQSAILDVFPSTSEIGRPIENEEVKLRPSDETTANRRSKRDSKSLSHERKPSSSSSSGKSTTSMPLQASVSEQRQSSVRLRDSAAQRRERRKAGRHDEQPHSSSGNWSASSESGRASVNSETTTVTHPPKSTTTASIGTSSTSLCHMRRFKGRDTSASSSVTSEGTLTPDIIQDITVIPFSDDGETSSVYSCDTEGYYTSFHVDSGLKTLREEELIPQSPLTKSVELHPDPASPLLENEYELYGRGSTSTTTSSAGTVCTTLLAPPPPERKSSLTVVAMVHSQKQNGGESPDSGHNTSSSPVESASSPACTGRSCSEFEYSESSDLEGCERIERIRSKTAINTSRIPSMCVITPPGSDDEHNHVKDNVKEKEKKERKCQGSVLMSATVGTSKMEVINGDDKNLYATVETIPILPPTNVDKLLKTSPLSGVLGKLRGVLPGKKHQQKLTAQDFLHDNHPLDSGDYVTIADVRNNNDKHQDSTTSSANSSVTYANADLFGKDAEYVSLSDLPRKQDSSLERRRQGARVTLDSEGKVVYSSDSLRRRKGAHTTFIPGPFVKEGSSSPASSPLLRRSQVTPRAVTKTTTSDKVDGNQSDSGSTHQSGKLIIRAAKSPDRAVSPDYVRTPATVVSPTNTNNTQRFVRGAYVNVQGDEDKGMPIVQSNEPVSTTTNLQKPPPPYQDPPSIHKPHIEGSLLKANDNRSHYQTNHQNQICQNVSYNNQRNIDLLHHQPNYQNKDPYSNSIYNKKNIFQPRYVFNCPNNQKLFVNQVDNSVKSNGHDNQFYTLPNRRPQKVIPEPIRSITPDITRGLSCGSINPMHIIPRQGQKLGAYYAVDKLMPNQQNHVGYNYQMGYDNNAKCAINQQTQNQNLVDTNKRFASPIGCNAFGYRAFFSPIQENIKNLPISPIGPESKNGFKSSTPTSRGTPTVAERLALQASRCASPNPALMASYGRNTPIKGDKGNLTSSGRSTPTNLILSPTRSTMSNEELFAAIHKSKKRLNIRDDPESLSPASSCGSLANNQIGTRHSWSPESQKIPEIPKTVLSPSSTSRLDFKRLLLQQSIKTGPNKISATEQLKLSRSQNQQEYQQPIAKTANPQQNPLAKVLSPRSAWRFHTPRTDVLSSTIIEDAAAEEKAMKPSPDNSLTSKISTRRQLDLSSDSIKKDNSKDSEEIKYILNDNKNCKLEKKDKEIENRLSIRKVNNNVENVQKNIIENPIKAIESRRMSNQLARAQFLASSVPSNNPENTKDFFSKRFRARSESPQQNAQRALQNNVTRCPSAPTLETAL